MGMALSKSSNADSRFTDLYAEPVDRLLSPIRGYEDQPFVPLTEAVKSISGSFDTIEDYVFVAIHNCQNAIDGLAPEESASIYLYTMKFHGGPSLYVLLNQSLRAENREELKPWFPYLKLFLSALYKLPSQSKTVWRGIRDVDLSSTYKTGTKFAWWGVSSCTTNIEVLESKAFLGRHGERTLFSIECINGKSVGNHSYYKNTEKEIILMPGSYFEVIGQLNPARQLHIIQLKEIPPPITFVRPPFSISVDASSSPKVDTSSAPSSLIPNKIAQSTSPNPTSLKSNTKWKQHGITIAGGKGKGDRTNQLNRPGGIFIDDNQTLYIADSDNHRIVEWKSNAKNGKIVAGGNGYGRKSNQLDYPADVIVDKENDCFIITDFLNRRVIRWPRQNNTHGQIIISAIECKGLTMDNNGYLYTVDYEKHEVRRWKIGDKNGTLVAGGDHLNRLNHPARVFVDQDYSLYVSDRGNDRVMKWTKDAKQGIVVAGGNGKGNSLAQLSNPEGVIVDQFGQIYVADYGNDRVMHWCEGALEGNIVVGGNGDANNQIN